MTAPRRRRLSWPLFVALLLVLLFILWFSYLAVARHETLQSEGYDLGNVDQMVWNSARGRLFQFTNWTGKDEYVRANSRLAMHVEPIYGLIVPLYWLWADVRLLLVLQVIVAGLGGIGIWLLARDMFTGRGRAGVQARGEIDDPVAGKRGPSLAEWAATALVAAFLLHPGLQSAVLDDFHAVTLAAGFIPFALFFLLRRSYGWFALFALLTAATKEEMPLVVALMGLYAFFFLGLRCQDPHERRRALWLGGATFLLGVAWSALALLVIIPSFNLDGQSPYLSRYSHLSDGGEAGLLALPAAALAALVQPNSLRYLWDLLLSTGFLAIFDLPLLLIASPSLAINLLSGFGLQLEGRHYIAPVIPILLAATAGGIAWLQGVGASRSAPRRAIQPALLSLALAIIALAFTLAAQVVAGYTPLARDFQRPAVTEHHRLLPRFLAQIPPDASVSTQQTLNPHLTQRAQISIIPFDVSGEYALLDVLSYPDFNNHDIHTWLVRNVIETGDYGPVDGDDGFLLLRRGAPADALPDAFYDFARVDEATPQFPAQVDFGDALRFLGFDLLPNPGADPFYALYFQPLRPLDRDFFITLYLADERFQLQGGIELPQKMLVWYPTSMWQPGETVRVVVDTLTWFSDPLDSYSVALGVLDGDDIWNQAQRLRPAVYDSELSPRLLNDGQLLHLMRFDNSGREPTPLPEYRKELPQPSTPISDAQFENLARLVGFYLPAESLAPGDELKIDLHWQALEATPTSYTVFVQLLGPDGQLYGQQDNPPGIGTLLSDRWQPGDLIRDEYSFPVAEDAPPGAYQLIVGLYDPATGQRLTLADSGQTHVVLSMLEVRR